AAQPNSARASIVDPSGAETFQSTPPAVSTGCRAICSSRGARLAGSASPRTTAARASRPVTSAAILPGAPVPPRARIHSPAWTSSANLSMRRPFTTGVVFSSSSSRSSSARVTTSILTTSFLLTGYQLHDEVTTPTHLRGLHHGCHPSPLRRNRGAPAFLPRGRPRECTDSRAPARVPHELPHVPRAHPAAGRGVPRDRPGSPGVRTVRCSRGRGFRVHLRRARPPHRPTAGAAGDHAL